MSAKHIERGDWVRYRQGRGHSEGRVTNVDREKEQVFIYQPRANRSIKKNLHGVTFVAGPGDLPGKA